MECPEFLTKTEDIPNLLLDFGGSPVLYIYKSIELEDQQNRRHTGIITIKKILFVMISVSYYLDFDNKGIYKLIK